MGARIHVHGHWYAEGSAESEIYIGLTQGETGYWRGIYTYAGSKLVFSYARITQAEVGIYVAAGADVNVTYSWIVANQWGMHVYDDADGADPILVANYNQFESNVSYNIYAEQTVVGYFGTSIDARWNWWGSIDVALINRFFYDRSDNASLGLWINFGKLWLDQTGVSIWESAYVGNVTSSTTYDADIHFVGYSVFDADVTLSSGTVMTVEAGASVVANADVTIAERARLVLNKGAYVRVSEDQTIVMDPETDVSLGVKAKLEIYGEMIARAKANQAIIFKGPEDEICL